MADHSTIEWTDATWNPIGGCSIESPGCAPCYAQRLAGTRLRNHPLYAGTTKTVKGKPVFNGKLTVAADDHPVWRWPIGWRGAKSPKLGAGMPSLIFVGDMSDLFHEKRPFTVVDQVVAPILYSRHIGQLLTKRPAVMAAYFTELRDRHQWALLPHPLFGKSNFTPEATFENAVLPRLWLGASAERQREFDERWPHLRALAAMGFTIFISYEPAIGPLVLPDDFLALGLRAQLIAGGMSGHEATPAHPAWFRDVRDQCTAAGVPFLFKQWGAYLAGEGNHGQFDQTPMHAYRRCDTHSYEWPKYSDVQNFGTHADRFSGSLTARKVGKGAAGRLLDGALHDGFPEVSAA